MPPQEGRSSRSVTRCASCSNRRSPDAGPTSGCWWLTRPPWWRKRRHGVARSSSSALRPRRSPTSNGTTEDRGGRGGGACDRPNTRRSSGVTSDPCTASAGLMRRSLTALVPARSAGRDSWTASPAPFRGGAIPSGRALVLRTEPRQAGARPFGLRSLSRVPRRPHAASSAALVARSLQGGGDRGRSPATIVERSQTSIGGSSRFKSIHFCRRANSLHAVRNASFGACTARRRRNPAVYPNRARESIAAAPSISPARSAPMAKTPHTSSPEKPEPAMPQHHRTACTMSIGIRPGSRRDSCRLHGPRGLRTG